jgi:hypothetical protein
MVNVGFMPLWGPQMDVRVRAARDANIFSWD